MQRKNVMKMKAKFSLKFSFVCSFVYSRKMQSIVKFDSALPKVRGNLLNPRGWGFNDSQFKFDADKKLTFTGDRYETVKKGLPFNAFKVYLMENFGVNFDNVKFAEKIEQREENYAPRVENLEFEAEIKKSEIDFTVDFDERLFRSHGQSVNDTICLVFTRFQRICDLVLFPKSHRDVEVIVKLANAYNVALVPVGGCTNVTDSCLCPAGENRQIAIVDCSQMNKMLYIDKENFLACFESGIVGQDLEKILKSHGFTMGHEPDSIELSTLGGWISTRASGMKQNKYGNIENIARNIKIVTSAGTLNRKFEAPRVSMGPNVDELILGSEGIFGIITEVVVKIHPAPKVKRYGSIVFYDFETGADCMREIAKSSCQPASLRLVDNYHVEASNMVKQYEGKFKDYLESFKRSLLARFKNFDLKKMAIATFLFEGDKDEIDRDEEILLSITKTFGGFSVGEHYGKIGYQATFFVAYFRVSLVHKFFTKSSILTSNFFQDLFYDFGVFAESYETSVTWSKCKSLMSNAKSVWQSEMEKRNIKIFQFGYRISQIYHDGVCCYFYFSLRMEEGINEETFKIFKNARSKLLDAIHSSGGSLSHHHGIGAKLKNRYEKTLSAVEMKILKAIKREIDPKNIFAVSNLLSDDSKETLKAKL